MIDGQLESDKQDVTPLRGDYAGLNDDVQQWFDDVNRGGLVEVKEQTLELFQLIECLTCHQLQKAFGSTANKTDIHLIVEFIIKDEGVHCSWLRIAAGIPEDLGSTLLRGIIELWLKMRGHSMASQIVESYKQSAAKETRQRNTDDVKIR